MSTGDTVPTPNDPVSQKAAFWFSMVKFVGWPGVILMFIGVGVYRVGNWAMPICENVASAHVTVITGLLDNQVQSTQLLKEMKDEIRGNSETLQKHDQILLDIHRAVLPAAAKNRPTTTASQAEKSP